MKACAVLLFAACAGNYPAPVGPVPAGMDSKQYEVMQRVAARHLNCGQGYLAYSNFGNGRHLFTGCGDQAEMLLLEGSDAKAYGQAYEYVSTPSPTYRFSKETGCPLQQTTHERVDYKTRIVAGCGSRITYVNVQDANGSYSWIANVQR